VTEPAPKSRLFADKHEIEMADFLLEQVTNDGVSRSWDACKKLAADQLQEMGLAQDLAENAVWVAIKLRSARSAP
jgi:hypothetical protein